MTDAKWGWFNKAVVSQFGAELAAGKYSEYPALKQIWIEEQAARAEKAAHYQACFEIAAGADKNWLAEN